MPGVSSCFFNNNFQRKCINSPVKTCRLDERTEKQYPIWCLHETHLISKNTHKQWQSSEGKKIFHVNRSWKQARVAIIICNKPDLKTKTIQTQ
jgi:hypothetical protein